MNFQIKILVSCYENSENIEKGVPQTAKISKLEQNFFKSPSQLEFGGEHLFWGTAREVLFILVSSIIAQDSLFVCLFILWYFNKSIQCYNNIDNPIYIS